MLELTEYFPASALPGREPYAELELPFEQRQKSRQLAVLANGERVALALERGTVLRGGDFVSAEDGRLVKIRAAPEELYKIISATAHELCRVAYHLGNRHVGMELRDGELLIKRDHVLLTMLKALGARVEEITAPFEPEGGAYGHGGHHHHRDEHSGAGRIHEYAAPASTDKTRLAVLVRLLDLSSPSLPVGAFCYSQGLEAAVDNGWVKDRESAKQWLRHMLVGVAGKLEAPVWLRLYSAWREKDHANAARWNEYFLATRETSELRNETVQMGYSLRRLLASLEDARLASPPEIDEASFVALFSFAAAAFGIPAVEGLTAYLWAWLENQVMAAVKAVPLGQTDGRLLLLELGDLIPEVTLAAAVMQDDELAASAPLGAMASMLHETQYTRLFRS